MTESANKVKANDMSDVEAMLVSQAMVLNGMFADLTNRFAMNRTGGYFDASQAYLKMAFKAQNQARMTLETLSNIKNPPVVYAKQANIAHGPQQVNNGQSPVTRTEEKTLRQSNFLEASNEHPMDTGTPGSAGRSNSATGSRRKNRRGQRRLRARPSWRGMPSRAASVRCTGRGFEKSGRR